MAGAEQMNEIWASQQYPYGGLEAGSSILAAFRTALLLKGTPVAKMRVNEITGDGAEQLKFPGSAANANCALRTLRRMLHKAEEWKMLGRAPKIRMKKEHGRHLRLDDDAERKLLEGAKACTWRRQTVELFRDIVILMHDTGMRNQRELYRMRIESLDCGSRVIFVPDSKTAEGRRLVPMNRCVFELLRARCSTRTEGCFRLNVPLLHRSPTPHWITAQGTKLLK
jgi:hypothetical protein